MGNESTKATQTSVQMAQHSERTMLLPLQTDSTPMLVKIFSENNEWRGYLFLDVDKETQTMVDEISSTMQHARPAVLSSKLNKKKRDILY